VKDDLILGYNLAREARQTASYLKDLRHRRVLYIREIRARKKYIYL